MSDIEDANVVHTDTESENKQESEHEIDEVRMGRMSHESYLRFGVNIEITFLELKTVSKASPPNLGEEARPRVGAVVERTAKWGGRTSDGTPASFGGILFFFYFHE